MVGGPRQATPPLDGVRAWKAAMRPVRDAVYGDFVDALGCGPFDGGCLAFAEALRTVLGGDVVVLVRSDGVADHAALRVHGKLWDFDGPLDERRFVDRFNRTENARCVAVRPFREGDLREAPRHVALERLLVGRLAQALLPDTELAEFLAPDDAATLDRSGPR